MTSREAQIADTFVELADTLVAEFDLIDFLHTLVERAVTLLDADAGGVMLAEGTGTLQQAVWSVNPDLPLADVRAVTRADPADMTRSWPVFTPRVRAAGYASAQAVPMRLRDEVIGALNVFRVLPGALSAADMRLARALADVATVGLMQARAIQARNLLAEQLQGALNSRVLIEQAKGVLAERSGLQVDQAFTVLRTHARRNGVSLGTVAAEVVAGRIQLP